jgi:hypothetical protein
MLIYNCNCLRELISLISLEMLFDIVKLSLCVAMHGLGASSSKFWLLASLKTSFSTCVNCSTPISCKICSCTIDYEEKCGHLTDCDYKVSFEPNWKDETEIMLWSAHQITLFMNSFSHCPIDYSGTDRIEKLNWVISDYGINWICLWWSWISIVGWKGWVSRMLSQSSLTCVGWKVTFVDKKPCPLCATHLLSPALWFFPLISFCS